MPIFDTHAHYDSNGFNADRDQVLSALPSVEDDATTKVILERVILGARRRGDGIQSGVHQGP